MNHLTISSILACCLLVACGSDEEAPATAAETPAAEGEAMAAPDEAPSAASEAYSCRLESHCREYPTLPRTVEGPGGASMEMTVEIMQGECAGRQGTWAHTPCNAANTAASCDDDTVIWRYPADADLTDAEELCNEVREGTWTTP